MGKRQRNKTGVTTGNSRPKKHQREKTISGHTCRRQENARADDNSAEDQFEVGLFPDWLIWIIHVLTIFYRLHIVTDRKNWWILHPDEVYQSVEVAHSEVYGYGFRPYEFLPPPDPNSNATVDQQEAALGMYSMRSFLYPRLYMAAFQVHDYIGISSATPFMVAKVFHSFIAAHLPLSVYWFMKSFTKSKDVSTLAALLIAFSEHLTVLGTHTLINSFLSPFVFLLLASLRQIIEESIIHQRAEANQNLHLPIKQDGMSVYTQSGPRNISIWETENIGSLSIHGNSINCNDYNFGKEKMVTRPLEDSSSETSESIDDLSDNENHESALHQTKTFIPQIFVCGMGFGILGYIRVDLVLFLVIAIIIVYPFVKTVSHNITIILNLVIGVFTSIILAGIEDLYSYGTAFISPKQWYNFNIKQDMGSILFGSNSSLKYIESILLHSVYTKLLSFVILFCFIISLFQSIKKQPSVHYVSYIKFLVGTILLLTIYSLKGHKEIRFVHNVIVLYMCFASMGVCLLINYCSKISLTLGKIVKYFNYIFILVYCLNIFFNLPSSANQHNARWSHLNTWDSGYVNECFEYVGNQGDATGVFSDSTIHMTGGYTILHKEIPIFSLLHYEFNEFSLKKRKIIKAINPFGPFSEVKVSVMNRVSNYITIENSKLLMKYLIDNPKYNYMVLKNTRKFISFGYEEVFASGNMRVYRRTKDAAGQQELQNVAIHIPIGTNATILEYEGSWLMTLGLNDLALERLQAGVNIDASRIRIYQLLNILYSQSGNSKDAEGIMKLCFRLNGRGNCLTPQEKVSLHSDYRIALEL